MKNFLIVYGILIIVGLILNYLFHQGCDGSDAHLF